MSLPVPLDSSLPSGGRYERYTLPFAAGDLLLACSTRLANVIAFLRTDHTLRRLTFGAGRIHVTDVAADYFQIVSGGQLSSLQPGPFAHACTYLQSRRVVVYDIARKDCSSQIVTDIRNLEEIATSAAWVSPGASVLAVQIEDTSRYDAGIVDFRLRSFDVSPEGKRPLGMLELGPVPPRDFRWHAGQGLVVVLRDERLAVWGSDLTTPLDHPLVAIAQELQRDHGPDDPGRRLVDLRIHPTRTCAALLTAPRDPGAGSVLHLVVATWGEQGPGWAHVATAPPGARVVLDEISIDGDHLAFSVEVNRRRRYYLLPMGAEASSPVALGVVAGARARCWTRAPSALVVFDAGGLVHRWRLDAPIDGAEKESVSAPA